MPQFLTCVPGANGAAAVAPCPQVEGVGYVPAMVEMQAPGSVHFNNANTLFAYGFGLVIVFWAIGKCIGAILSLIQKGS